MKVRWMETAAVGGMLAVGGTLFFQLATAPQHLAEA